MIPMKSKMQWSYLFKHWFATLLIAPFLYDFYVYVDMTDHYIGYLVGDYPIVLIDSLIFSVPTFAIYTLIFHFLEEKAASITFSKIMLIGISVTGVLITFMGIGLLDFPLIIAYMLTSLFTGIFFRLEKKASD